MPEAAIADAPQAGSIETPDRDWSKLSEFVPDDEPSTEAPAASTAAEPAKEAPKDGTPAPIVEDTPEELKNLDALLAEDKDEPVPVEEPKAVVTPEIQQLDQLKSDPLLAKDFMDAARDMLFLQQQIGSGDMGKVLAAFTPQLQGSIKEHIYQQNKEAFVKRFIDEHEGKSSTPDPEVARLRAELDGIKSSLTEEQKRKQAQEQQGRTQAQQKAYGDYWDGLFKAVNVTDPKQKSLLRGWVLDSIAESARAGDKDARKAAEQIRSGRLAPIGKKFREVYPEWIKDQKAKTTADTQIRNAQEQKQTGKLGTTATETTSAAEQDFDSDGKRTKGYWERGLKKIGLLD